MKLNGKKIAIFTADLHDEREFWYPYYRMIEEGAEVTVIGPHAGTFAGKTGLPVTADLDIHKANTDEFDALIIPGGYGPDHMRRVPAMVEFVKHMHEEGKVVAAICHAGWMLASAEILQGRTVTSYIAIRDDLVHAGAEWIDRDVVIDSNIITSRFQDDLPSFTRAIIDTLSK